MIQDLKNDENEFLNALEEKQRKYVKKSIFGRSEQSFRAKNSVLSMISYTKLLESPLKLKENKTEEKKQQNTGKTRRSIFGHRKQKSLAIRTLINFRNFKKIKFCIAKFKNLSSLNF